MPEIVYVPKKFAAASLQVIDHAREIIEEYAADDYDLTLRQLYYQFVARGYLANTQKEYKRLGSIVNDGRLAGLIDWHSLVDRTRELEHNSHWSNPENVITAAAAGYAIDKWEGQPFRVEVWVEKEALAGVVERTCRRLDVAWFSCRGYVSQSEMWRAAERHRAYEDEGQAVVVLHLGDHDPSGQDMTRDIQDRLELFEADTVVERIALNMEQVRQYDPPPNPAKITDSRAAGYIAKYGRHSWELDALDPRVLDALIQHHVEEHLDHDAYGDLLQKEGADLKLLRTIAGEMPRIREMLNGEAE